MLSEHPPPFEIDVALPRDGAEANLLVTFIRGDEDPEDNGETTLAPCCEVLELFARAQEGNLFSAGKRTLRKSRMALVSHETPDSSASSCTYRFNVRNVEPNSFLVLLALLAQTKYAYAPLKKLLIQTSDYKGISLVTGKELLGFPRGILPCVEEPPFNVEWAKHVSSRARVVTYRLEKPISDDGFRQVAEWFNIWDHLAVLGGFRLDFQEQDSLPPFGETVRLAPRVIAHRVHHYDGHEQGFCALVNLAAMLHETGYPILDVEID